MTSLKPVDFKAVAAKGAFVYCYLRHSDSKTAAANSPYYIGVAISDASGQRHRRPLNPSHKAPVPFDKSLIRILRSGLTPKEAERWEIFFIAHYGREKDGGILLNHAEGGGVNHGWNHSDEWKKANGERCKNRVWSPESCAKISEAKKGAEVAPWSAERRANFKASEKQIETCRALGHSWKGKKHTVETIAKMAAAKRGKLRSADCKLKIVETKARQYAAKIGVDAEALLALNKKQRATLQQRFNRGWSVDRLFEGLAAA